MHPLTAQEQQLALQLPWALMLPPQRRRPGSMMLLPLAAGAAGPLLRTWRFGAPCYGEVALPSRCNFIQFKKFKRSPRVIQCLHLSSSLHLLAAV